jgi:hypothetical protein
MKSVGMIAGHYHACYCEGHCTCMWVYLLFKPLPSLFLRVWFPFFFPVLSYAVLPEIFITLFSGQLSILFMLISQHSWVYFCCWFNQGLNALPFLCKVSKQLCLTPLPSVYQDLLWRSIREKCKVCGNVPMNAAFCLICGDLLCFTSKCSDPAAEHGVCSTHAEQEYAGIGIFLHMRTTQVLLMRGNRVCTLPSIYLDQHGEEDYELRRNQKLYKSELRLNEVQSTVYLASLLQVAWVTMV